MQYTRKQNLAFGLMCAVAALLLGRDVLGFGAAVQAAGAGTVDLALLGGALPLAEGIPAGDTTGYLLAMAVIAALLALAAAAFLVRFARGSREQDEAILKARYLAVMKAGREAAEAMGEAVPETPENAPEQE